MLWDARKAYIEEKYMTSHAKASFWSLIASSILMVCVYVCSLNQQVSSSCGVFLINLIITTMIVTYMLPRICSKIKLPCGDENPPDRHA